MPWKSNTPVICLRGTCSEWMTNWFSYLFVWQQWWSCSGDPNASFSLHTNQPTFRFDLKGSCSKCRWRWGWQQPLLSHLCLGLGLTAVRNLPQSEVQQLVLLKSDQVWMLRVTVTPTEWPSLPWEKHTARMAKWSRHAQRRPGSRENINHVISVMARMKVDTSAYTMKQCG